MNRDLVLDAVPNADPKFIAIISKMPDPNPDALPRIIVALPKLHHFYLQKRDAFKRKDLKTFEEVLEQEIQFVRNLDVFATHY